MPQFNCPDCHQPLVGDPLGCISGHTFRRKNGVLVLLSTEFEPQVTEFLTRFSVYRASVGRHITDPDVYEQLPTALLHDPEWRQRAYDLAVIDSCLQQFGSSCNVLEIGAYNGWLSNYLAKQGHEVTAVDEFVDPYDGLGAHKFYTAEWLPVQADTRDWTVFASRYDVVILNRCAQFFLDPVAYVAQAIDKAAQGSMLILLGLAFFRDSKRKAAEVAASSAGLAAQGMELFKPNKGYLDFDDKAAIQELGIKLKPYPQLRMRMVNWRARIQPQRAAHYWGVFQK